jgi:hypothetical protein
MVKSVVNIGLDLAGKVVSGCGAALDSTHLPGGFHFFIR